MHQHDQDLIMALAEGILDEGAAASARAEIMSCPECAADLELQDFALAALNDMPDAALTEFESARLRRDLRNELGVFKEEVRFEPTKQRRRFPFAALGTAAAVLIAVVAVAPRLNLVTGGDADTVALETTAAPATTAAASFDAQASGGGAEEHADTTAAPTTAPLAATTTTFPVPSATLNVLGYYAENPDLGQLRSRLEAQDYEPEFAIDYALKDAGAEVPEDDAATVDNCLAVTLSLSEEFVDGFQFARGSFDGRESVFYVFLAEDPEESAVVVLAADTCEELGRAGP